MSSGSTIISVTDLSHRYGEGELARTILCGITTEFRRGEINIIMGPSGAGKTTFLTLLSGLRSVQSGSVKVDGRELRGMSEKELVKIRRRIGFIFQAQNLLDSLTVRENVQLGLGPKSEIARGASIARALDRLEEVGLLSHADKLPRQLSGGQKQRVAIARALIREPEVIMADEPTAALDSQTGRDVVDLLQNLARKKGCSILLVTHDNRILDFADRIIHIEDGVMEETHLGMDRTESELLRLSSVLARYPSVFSREDSELEALRDEFNSISAPLTPALSELIRSKMAPDVDQRANALNSALTALQNLELTLFDTKRYLSRESLLQLPSLAESFVQTLEFLLLTAKDAFEAEENISMLAQLTGDRGQIMESLHQRYEQRSESHIKRDLFDVTTSFSRSVYFLNQLASSLDEARGPKNS